MISKLFERDANWECRNRGFVIFKRNDVLRVLAFGRCLWNNSLEAAQEIEPVAIRLKPYQLVFQKRTQNGLTPRQLLKNVWRWKRNMQEESCTHGAASFAQIPAH